MQNEIGGSPSSATLTGPVLSNMLLGEDEFDEPVLLLRDLTETQACAHFADYPETIAKIAGHMQFWQHRNLSVIRGENPPYPADQREGWPEIGPEQWPGLVSNFLDDLDSMMGLTENDTGLLREIAEAETVADRIRWTAVHNAYHFGQIVLLRRGLGFWPPEGGENTW